MLGNLGDRQAPDENLSTTEWNYFEILRRLGRSACDPARHPTHPCPSGSAARRRPEVCKRVQHASRRSPTIRVGLLFVRLDVEKSRSRRRRAALPVSAAIPAPEPGYFVDAWGRVWPRSPRIVPKFARALAELAAQPPRPMIEVDEWIEREEGWIDQALIRRACR